MDRQAIQPPLVAQGEFVHPRSILLIRLSSLGDVVLATPLARVLRQQFPQALIDVVVAREFAEVWKNNPHINQVLCIDKARSAFATISASNVVGIRESYDVAIDLQDNIRSWVLRHRYAKRSLIIDKHRREKLDLVRHKRHPAHITHVVDRYFNAAADLGIENDHQGLELWLDADKRSGTYLAAESAMPGQFNVVFAPGARHATKRWPEEYWKELADELIRNYHSSIVLVGSAADNEICNRIAAFNPRHIENRCGLSLEETARIMDSAMVVVSHDSGAMHIAAARRKALVAIFGSTVRDFGFTPYGTKSEIVEQDLSCRPCSHIGRAECPLGHFNCMRTINAHMVRNAIARVVELPDISTSSI